jgi:hypothetical protein
VPEYDDCRTVAERNRVPLLTVIETAGRLYERQDGMMGDNKEKG